MSAISVMFDVPQDIQQALIDGTMKLWGGVVRNLRGQIVAHLSPGKLATDAVTSGVSLDPVALTTAIGHAKSAALFASGIGAVNLAVNVAGFAMIRQKLGDIMEQIDRVLTELSYVKEGVEHLVAERHFDLLAEIDSACDLASRATRLQDRELFKEARTSAHRARRKMIHLLQDILEKKRVISLRQKFAHLSDAYVILATVEARCDEPVEGVKQAATHMAETTQELQRLVTRFGEQCRDYGADTEARIRLGPDGIKELHKTMAGLRNSVEGLNTLAGEFTFRGLIGVAPDRWREMTKPPGSGWVTCVRLPDAFEPESLAAVQREAQQGLS